MILKNKTQLFAASKWLISALKKNVDSKWGDKICDSKQMAVRTKQAKYVLLLLFTQSCPALQSHGLQHVRLLCPLPSPRVCSDCCLFSLWCYLTISSSATPVSFCLHSFLASRSFPMKGLFPSGGQSLYVKWSEVAQSCLTLCDPWTVAHQAPQSMAFSRQEYWSGLPFPSPGDLPDPGSNLGLPHCKQTLYRLSPFFGGRGAGILQWVAIPFSRRSSQPRDWTQVSRIVVRHFSTWATHQVAKACIAIYISDKIDFNLKNVKKTKTLYKDKGENHQEDISF